MTAQGEVDKWMYWIWDPSTTWSQDEGCHMLAGFDQDMKNRIDVLRAVGERGWELVNVTETIYTVGVNFPVVETTRFYFKRKR